MRLRLSVCESRQTAAANVTITRDHAGPPLRADLLWFDECPNHAAARGLLTDALGEMAPGTTIGDIDATDPAVALLHRFPGSPTIRINGEDVDPAFHDPGDYTPRCRLYWTSDGLRGLPERAWIDAALRVAIADQSGRITAG
jgi:hypothetical protein